MYTVIFRSPKVSVIDITATNPLSEGIEVAWRGGDWYLGRLASWEEALAVKIAQAIDAEASTEEEAQAIFDRMAPEDEDED